jgi:hypothetical protein
MSLMKEDTAGSEAPGILAGDGEGIGRNVYGIDAGLRQVPRQRHGDTAAACPYVYNA